MAAADLGDRITLRKQAVTELSDSDAYDCAWVPTFFLTEADLEKALPALVEALHPGGWIALGLMRPPPDPVAAAVANLRTIRGGGCVLTAPRAIELLEAGGCTVGAHGAAPTTRPPRADPRSAPYLIADFLSLSPRKVRRINKEFSGGRGHRGTTAR